MTAQYQYENGWWSAWILEIPGINTQGGTLKEAVNNLLDAAEGLNLHPPEFIKYALLERVLKVDYWAALAVENTLDTALWQQLAEE